MVTTGLVDAGDLNVLLVPGGPFGVMGEGKRECLHAACLGDVSGWI